MLKHVFDRHGKEIGAENAEEAMDFVLDVMRNYDHVRQGDKGAIIFSVEDNRTRTGKRAVTILLDSQSGDYYGIKTSGYERIDGLTKRPLLWEKGANITSATDVATANVSTKKAQQDNGQSGSASNQVNGTSEGKDNKSLDTKQGKGNLFSQIMEEAERRKSLSPNLPRREGGKTVGDVGKVGAVSEKGNGDIETIERMVKAANGKEGDENTLKARKKLETLGIDWKNATVKGEKKTSDNKKIAYNNIVDVAGNEESIREIFDANNDDKENSMLMDRVLPVAAQLGVKMKLVPRANIGKGQFGVYDSNSNTVTVAASKNAIHIGKTMLHELIHGVTSRAISLDGSPILTARQQEGVDALKHIFDNLKRYHADIANDYGMKNVKEMVAELSNGEFRSKLKKIKLFKRVVDGIAHFFNGVEGKPTDDVKEVNAYEEVKSALEKIIDGYDKDFKENTEEVTFLGNDWDRSKHKPEEDEIVKKAKADGTYMKAPNGNPTRLSAKQWVQVRTKAFKDWFGDWELGHKTVNIVKTGIEHGFKNFGEARGWAKKNISRTLSNDETNGKGNIRISNTAIDKFLSESSIAKSESKDVHLAVLRILPDVIRESIDAEQHSDYLKGAQTIFNGDKED